MRTFEQAQEEAMPTPQEPPEEIATQFVEVLEWTLGQMYSDHPPLRDSGFCFYCDQRVFLRKGHSSSCLYGRALSLLDELKSDASN